jgi:hypothetical protein
LATLANEIEAFPAEVAAPIGPAQSDGRAGGG